MQANFTVEPILSDTNFNSGLSNEQVSKRLAQWGPNEISITTAEDGWLFLLTRQFQSSVIVLLLVAAVISYIFSEHLQSLAILTAVAVNAFVGFITEFRAKVSLQTLRKLSSPKIRARRNGEEIDLPTHELVPGDVVSLEAGVRVPADVKLFKTCGINVDESALTGESVAVFKSLPSTDEGNDIVYQGTLVLDGQAWAIVTATALQSRLGKLGKLLTEISGRRTPLELELEGLGKQLCWMTLILCLVLLVIGILHNEPIVKMTQTSIALAVAAIPEGLAVVATLALAVGTQRMVKSAVLIRQLSSVETLGCCAVICSDKTGTLTENRMQVTEIFSDGKQFTVSGEGYIPVGHFQYRQNKIDVQEENNLHQILITAAVCNDAFLEDHAGKEDWHIHGDPTEGALLVVAAKAGLNHAQLTASYPRVDELPFDLTRKRMTTINQVPQGGLICLTKGSPESVLKQCKFIQKENGINELNDAERNSILKNNFEMAKKGLRVLAIANKKLSINDPVDGEIESDLTFLGLIGMQDRAKKGVKEAILQCKAAGIRVVMLTGDQAQTAKSIGDDLGIIDSIDDDSVLSGAEICQLNENDLATKLRTTNILARVSPEMKLKVVRALQADGSVVAMTGDGVNDAPALRQSDIGVAMGKGGADLACESAKIVITDDNFSSIVKAIEQGRVIYANIQNAIAYLLTASLAAVATVAAAVLFDTGLPLLPLQLLWLNLIMHVFPALGISLLPSHKMVMKLSPRKTTDSILGRSEYMQILIRSFLVAAGTLTAVIVQGHFLGNSFKMTTISFATLSCALLFQAWLWAFSDRSFMSGGWKHLNPVFMVNMLISYALMFIAIYVRPIEAVLKTTHLDLSDWLIVLFASGLSFLASIVVCRLLPRTA
ncbi:MAG: cation-transporting P-type ATPase [Candidatus Obscuribacterales bacterium]|nr:cation-transporting P-type ATPase [Candidatus Obscuribacterales bacterium]